MTPDTNEFIQLVQARYHLLQLSFEQAEQVYYFEEEKNSRTGKEWFSDWEEWDYDEVFFKQVLTNEQFGLYEADMQNVKQTLEQSMIESDKQRLNDIAYREDILHYYDQHFLTPFFSLAHVPLITFYFSEDKIKLTYLKQEYKRYLNETKWKIIIQHYRHNKKLKPNELKYALLGHQLAHIKPDYAAFKYQMDDATKAIVQHGIKPYLHGGRIGAEELLEKQLQEAATVTEKLNTKYYPQPRSGGWHVYIDNSLNAAEEKEHNIMTLMLLDHNKYK